MKSRSEALEIVRAELAQQGAAWKQAVQSLEEMDPRAMIAVPPAMLEAIDEACSSVPRVFTPAPRGAIRA